MTPANPTPEEQLVLEYINRARANPTSEGTRLGIDMWESLCDLNDVGVRPPLAMNKILLQVADYHSWDMYTNNYFAHNDLSGHDPSQRMTNAGYSPWTWGENIAVGSSGYSATNLEDDLMVDSSTSCRSPSRQPVRQQLQRSRSRLLCRGDSKSLALE